MDFKEFSGKTVDDAIIEAATTLGVASSDLDTEIVSKGSAGFLGIGVKPAVIKAKVKDGVVRVEENLDEVVEDKPARKVEEKVAERSEDKLGMVSDSDKGSRSDQAERKKEDPFVPVDDSIVDYTREYLVQLFKVMELEADIDIQLDKTTNTLSIDVEGPEMGVIIGKRGQTLDSLQYLISLYVNKKANSYVRVKLDTENYRERRKETLENLAKNIAFKVKKSHRSVKLEPMNPYERRIIHSTLQNDKYVATKSEGEDPYRRVVVYPKKSNYKRR